MLPSSHPLSVPPISATYQCPSVPPISAHHCCISVQQHQCYLISAAYQCHLISATYQCPSVPPISAHQCCLSVQLHQRTSVKEKKYLFAKCYNRNKEKLFFSNFCFFFFL
ncbi:unnamed protein product [Staurois parvus]|uniref:Uncharacterized protein n=1 Tax=Staurois parvus TaxID=386267 RepID=A0ABN9BH23_9NEOB|nr:unnamed protein product [Staurois parvus]